MMTWVELLTLTVSCAAELIGTIAAFEMTVVPGPKVMIATALAGGDPVGHASRNAPCGVAAALTTVKLTEIAAGRKPFGRPQIPPTDQFRDSLLPKIPPWIGAPLPRVSAIRQGSTATNVWGSVTSVIACMPPADAAPYGGTVQFCSGTWTSWARARNEIARIPKQIRVARTKSSFSKPRRPELPFRFCGSGLGGLRRRARSLFPRSVPAESPRRFHVHGAVRLVCPVLYQSSFLLGG